MDLQKSLDLGERVHNALLRFAHETYTFQADLVGAWKYCEKCSRVMNTYNPFMKEDEKVCPTCEIKAVSLEYYKENRNAQDDEDSDV